MIPPPLADVEAHRRVVGLRLQPLDVAHVGLDVARLEEDEDARLAEERQLELRVLRPRLLAARVERVAARGPLVALELEVVLFERVALSASVEGVEDREPLPVFGRAHLLEEKVGLAVGVAVVGENGELEELLAPRLKDEGHDHIRRRRGLLKGVLGHDLLGEARLLAEDEVARVLLVVGVAVLGDELALLVVACALGALPLKM